MTEDYFADDLGSFGSAPAVVWEGGYLSYEALVEAADAFASRLGNERRLLLLECPNSVETLVSYVGALRGRHPVILTSADHPADTQRIIDKYRPSARYLISDNTWTLGLDDNGPSLHPELAVMLSTSGTTGATKLVRLSRTNIDANARSIATYLELAGSDRAVTSLPFHYSYGLSVVNSHLAVGAGLAITDRSVIEEEFWNFFEKVQATSLAGVPYTYELLDRIGFCEKPLRTLRTLTQAGGRLPPDTATRYAQWSHNRGVRFFVMYGQTEATARMAYMPPEMLLHNAGSIGVPIPGGSFGLVSAGGERIESPQTTGELVYRGPNVMMGYAEQAIDLAKSAELDALETGDLAQYDENGLYRIVGRKSRFSKLFGLRIALDEVEAMMRAQGLSGVAAGNDELIAVALTTNADPGAVQRTLSQAYALPKESFSVSVQPDLPLLPSGKVNYRLILADAMARKAQASDRKCDLDVYNVFIQAMPTRTITHNDSFASLGGDSLTFISILSRLDKSIASLPEGWEEIPISELQELAETPHDDCYRDKPRNDLFLPGVAIILILLGVPFHASEVFRTGPDWLVSSATGSSALEWFTDVIHSFRMFSFFLLGGYVSARTLGKAPDPLKWGLTRCRHLLLPLVSATLLLGPLELAVIAWDRAAHAGIAFSVSFVGVLRATDGNGWLHHRWFLVLLIIYTALFVILIWIARRLSAWLVLAKHDRVAPKAIVIVPALLAVYGYLAPGPFHYLPPEIFNGFIKLDWAVRYAPAFFVGTYLALSPQAFASVCAIKPLRVIVAGVCLALYVYFEPQAGIIKEVGFRLVMLPTGFLVCCMLMALARYYSFGQNAVLLDFVRGGYVIYLWHFVFVLLFGEVIIGMDLDPLFSAVLTAVMSFLTSYGIYRLGRNSLVFSYAFNGTPLSSQARRSPRRPRIPIAFSPPS